jgi:hypothetical protein
MTVVQHKQTIQWNIDRANTISSLELELKMFHEETREFWEATTLTDRVDAYCDSQFVAVGSDFKIGTNQNETLNTMILDNLNGMLCYMMLNDFKPTDEASETAVFNLLDACYQEVLIANQLKPTERVNGKIIKGDKWYDPKYRIQALVSKFN